MTEFPEFTPEQQARIAEVSRLKDLPYDGVAGTPPDWFPFHVRSEFLRIRSRLLLEYSAQHILLMIQHLAGTLVPPEEVEREGFYVSIPRRLRPDVYRLLDYKRAFDLGSVEGSDILLGKNIAGNARAGSSYRERTRRGGEKGAAARRKDAKSEHESVIQKAKVLLKAKASRRGLASLIKKSGCSDLSTRQINNILNSEMN